MGSTFKLIVMLGVLRGGVYAYREFGPLPPEAQRYVDQALAAAQKFIAKHAPRAATAARGESNPFAELPATNIPGFVPPACAVEAPPLFAEAAAALPDEPAAAAAPPAPANSAVAGDLQPLLDQLVGMGVGEYELSRWGSSGDLYRFRCAAPLAGSMDQTQQFEAVAPTPAASVEQVLGEVAQWRLARASGPMLR